MPEITRIFGSGMTRRAEIRFDAENPEDIQGLIAAGVHTLDRSSFHFLSRRLTKVARGILDDAGLPSDPQRLYLVSPDGTWSAPAPEALVDEQARYLPLDVAVQECGHEPDSPQGYAAAVLMVLMKARQHLQATMIDEAMVLAFAAGELAKEASMKEMFDPDFLVGEGVREGGRKGHEEAHGTEEEKAARRAEQLTAFDAARARGLSRTEAYEVAAGECGVSDRTIRRAVAEGDRAD